MPTPPAAWTALRIELAAELADAVTSFLVDEGAAGVLEEDGAVAGRVVLETAVATGAAPLIRERVARYLERLAAIHPAAGPARVDTAPVG